MQLDSGILSSCHICQPCAWFLGYLCQTWKCYRWASRYLGIWFPDLIRDVTTLGRIVADIWESQFRAWPVSWWDWHVRTPPIISFKLSLYKVIFDEFQMILELSKSSRFSNVFLACAKNFDGHDPPLVLILAPAAQSFVPLMHITIRVPAGSRLSLLVLKR